MRVRWVVLVILALVAGAAQGHRTSEQTLDAVGFEQRIGATLEVADGFRNVAGEPVSLERLNVDAPLILVLSWFECPDLCPMVLDQLARNARNLSFERKDYEVAVVSIDPEESPREARALRDRLEAQYGDVVRDWHFLTGSKAAIGPVADAIGFQYAYDAEDDRYAHPAGLVVLAAGGTVSQYLFDLRPDAPDLRLALLEASRGELGSAVDQLVLRCYRFDPDSGQYSLAVGRLMQVTGGASVLCLGAWVIWLRRREGP